MASSLPPGFTLDAPSVAPTTGELPAGFTLDAPASGEGMPGARQSLSKSERAQAARERELQYMSDLPSNFVSGAANFAGRIAQGVGTFIENPVETTKSVAMAPWNLGYGLGAKIAEPAAEAYLNYKGRGPAQGVPLPAAALAETRQAQEPANAVIQHIDEKYGSVDRAAESFRQDPFATLLDFSTVLGGGGAGLQGLGALTKAGKIAETGAVLTRAGELTNPLTPFTSGASALAEKATQKIPEITNKLSPTRRMLEPALEGNAEGVVNMLRNPNAALVAGTQPTVGEIVAGAGTSQTQLPALQFKLTSNPALASEFAAREAANARAQAASIGTIAPEIPADITSARQARAGQAAVDYGKVEKKIVPHDETLAALLETPAMKSAVSVAEDIAANKGRTFKTGENVPAHEVPSSIVDPATGKPVMRQIPAQNAEYTGQSLLDIKAGLDKALETKVDAAGSALGNKQLAAIGDVRQQYVNWLEDKLPGVKTARTEFAARSKPINAMEVGQVLKESLTSPLDETLRPAAFAQAVRNAPGTIKKATGAPRFEDLSAILDTADSTKVANVLSDLSRTAEYRRLAKAGGRPNAMGSVTDIPGAQGFIGQAATTIMKALEGVVSRKASIEIGAAMLHPETFARLVEKYAIPNAPRNIMERNARMLTTQERNVRRNNLLRGGVQTSNALAPQEAP